MKLYLKPIVNSRFLVFVYEILSMSYNQPILNICYGAGKVLFGILCFKLEQYHLYVMS